MAVTGGTVWRIRVSGSDSNGGGFDPTVTSPGTDFSQQDAAQVTYSDLVIGASNTLTSATTPFTSAHVGNVVNVTGGTGFTVGRFVVSSVSGSTATMNASPGTNGSTGGAGKLGGGLTLAGAFGALATPPAIAGAVQPGNTVYIRGAGSDTAASYPTTGLDYNVTGYFTPTDGSQAAGPVRWVGENGRPNIGCSGLLFYNCGYQTWENLYFCSTSNGGAQSFGTINGSGTKFSGLRNVILNLGNLAGAVGAQVNGYVVDCDIYGGSTSPATSAGSHGIITLGAGCHVAGNRVHHCRDAGIHANSGTGPAIFRNIIDHNAGNGIEDATASLPNTGTSIVGNTIDGNGGHGIAFTATAGIMSASAYNNEITNHAGTGKYGISVSDGSTALNDQRKRFLDYNNLSGNTGAYNNISAGAHDLALAPSYGNAAGGDWTPGNAALKAAFPGVIRGASA